MIFRVGIILYELYTWRHTLNDGNIPKQLTEPLSIYAQSIMDFNSENFGNLGARTKQFRSRLICS